MLPKLKQLRQEYGISQQRLADAVNVSQPSINKYENHNIEPDIAVLVRLADYFNTSVDYIIGHTEVRRRIEPMEVYHLNDSESDMMTRYRALSPDERHCIDLTIQTFLKK